MDKIEIEIPKSERSRYCFAACPQHVISAGNCKCSNEILSKIVKEKPKKENNK